MGVSAVVEIISYLANRALIAKNAKEGKINEGERDVLTKIQNDDAELAMAQVGITVASAGLALIPVAGLPLAGIYVLTVTVVFQRVRNAKRNKAVRDAVWNSIVGQN